MYYLLKYRNMYPGHYPQPPRVMVRKGGNFDKIKKTWKNVEGRMGGNRKRGTKVKKEKEKNRRENRRKKGRK